MNTQENTSQIFEFVVIDLETTGLSPENDTIIEIAAIKCRIQKDHKSESWGIVNQDARTMLVNPGFPISDEISLITHITNSMLKDAATWGEIRENVRKFIGNLPLVGHNVLFDIAMLKTHGINLEDSLILDTFEMAQILSYESESLNLGYLGKRYGYSTKEGEHRALGDTEIGLLLFLGYLNLLSQSDELTLSLLRLGSKKESKSNLGALLSIIGKADGPVYEQIPIEKRSTREVFTIHDKRSGESKKNIEIRSFGAYQDEHSFYKELLYSQNKKILIVCREPIVAQRRKEQISSLTLQPLLIKVRRSSYYSTRFIEEWIEKGNNTERKLIILFIRMILWIEKTESGILDEVKFYGSENLYKDHFRLEKHEANCYYLDARSKEFDSSIVITNSRDILEESVPLVDQVIIEDIGFFDEKIRIHESFSVDFIRMRSILEKYAESNSAYERCYYAINFLEFLYTTPIEKNINIESEGINETHFYEQDTLWKKNGIWLDIATKLLIRAYSELSWNETLRGEMMNHELSYIKERVEFLRNYHRFTSTRTSIIVESMKHGVFIRYIPRNIEYAMKHFIHTIDAPSLTYTGYGINGKKVQSYISRTLGIQSAIYSTSHNNNTPSFIIKNIHEFINIDIGGSLVLTTSMRHIRELGKYFERYGYNIYMQGISGGKSKILSLFKDNSKKSLIIGLIDSWKDEYHLNGHIEHVLIAKVPFDPPSDPYFLAKTVGLSNNFQLSSEPLAIMRLNRIIGNFQGYLKDISLYLLDERILTTEWGKSVSSELI